jgi:hypothetical protein
MSARRAVRSLGRACGRDDVLCVRNVLLISKVLLLQQRVAAPQFATISGIPLPPGIHRVIQPLPGHRGTGGPVPVSLHPPPTAGSQDVPAPPGEAHAASTLPVQRGAMGIGERDDMVVVPPGEPCVRCRLYAASRLPVRFLGLQAKVTRTSPMLCYGSSLAHTRDVRVVAQDPEQMACQTAWWGSSYGTRHPPGA